MACLHLTMLVPISLSLLSVFFLISVKTGFGMEDGGTCRAACVENDCVTVNLERMDFKSSEETCQDRNGELMAFQFGAAERILKTLLDGVYGSFWIGLRLPDGACSNLSAPLRGYQWTAGNLHRSFLPSPSTWKDSVKVCSPHCVSLSDDQKWTERPCSDETDGFLCKTKHKDACQAQELSDSSFFVSPDGCSDAPCEQKCKDVEGGYKCSCFDGYAPNSQDPHLCQLHCQQEKCPAMCNGGLCFCPEGFIRSENFCEDIDECEMQECDQVCENSFGGFTCSCWEGFILSDKGRCIPAEEYEGFTITAPVLRVFITPATNNTLKVSSASASGFLWIWICTAVVVVVCIFVVRYCVVRRHKRSEHNLQQRSVDHDNNVWSVNST